MSAINVAFEREAEVVSSGDVRQLKGDLPWTLVFDATAADDFAPGTSFFIAMYDASARVGLSLSCSARTGELDVTYAMDIDPDQVAATVLRNEGRSVGARTRYIFDARTELRNVPFAEGTYSRSLPIDGRFLKEMLRSATLTIDDQEKGRAAFPMNGLSAALTQSRRYLDCVPRV